MSSPTPTSTTTYTFGSQNFTGTASVATTSTTITGGGVASSGNYGSGMYYASNGTTWNTLSIGAAITLNGPDPKIKIDDGDIDLRELLFLMRDIKKRLCIIEEDMKRHEKYPALKDIYDQYKVVEAMVKSDEDE